MEGDAAFLDGLDAAMQKFKNTDGLVIDVRGNGGGRRDPLRRLAPYFLPKDGTPIVGNVAAFLLEEGKEARPDELQDRYLYGADWNGWSDAQRTAIGKFLRGFKPSWKLPRGKFSPWYFLVLDKQQNQNAFHYGKQVVVLMDRGCFSATDIFTGAMQAIPGVTLVGESTAGGSGRARRYHGHRAAEGTRIATVAPCPLPSPRCSRSVSCSRHNSLRLRSLLTLRRRWPKSSTCRTLRRATLRSTAYLKRMARSKSG